jgi:hypothetical protein
METGDYDSVSDIKSCISKCPHGVYDPSGTGVARYCTICTEPPEISEEDKLKILGKYTPWPHGKEVCPICGSTDVDYEDDYNFDCRSCGFDAMTS